MDDPIYGAWCWPEDRHYMNRSKKNNVWTQSVSVAGYEPNEIAIKEEKGDDGQVKLIVHAKRDKEDDFSEMKRSIKIPNDVDTEHVRTMVTREGNLVLKAPYKESINTDMQPMRLKREDTWNGIWGELGRMNEQMNQLIDCQGSLNRPRTEYVADESGTGGTWKLKVNVGKDFKPEEIKVRHLNDQIHLEAKKEAKDNKSWSSKYIHEVISIPNGVENDKLRSKLMDNGELVIEGPCKKIPRIGSGDEGQAIAVEGVKSGDNENMSMDN